MKTPHSQLKVMRTYATREAAEYAVQVLSNAGIPSMIQADDCGAMNPFLSLLRGVGLIVNENDFEKAGQIIKAAGNPFDTEKQPHN